MKPRRTIKNTPQSVLAFIGAHLDRIPEPMALAGELGYSASEYETLEDRHGDRLLIYLQRVQSGRKDTDRYLARQAGREHPEQYVGSHLGAIDDRPCVPRHYEAEMADKRLDGVRDVVAAMGELEQSIRDKLDDANNAILEGELKRALKQIERAKNKARTLVDSYEIDKAA